MSKADKILGAAVVASIVFAAVMVAWALFSPADALRGPVAGFTLQGDQNSLRVVQDAYADDVNGAALGVNFYQGSTDDDRILQ